jgi:hypothetical protein
MRLHKYNKNYALFKLHFKQHKEKYIRIGTLIFSITVFIIGIVFMAYAKFSTTNKYNVMQTSVGTFIEGDYILAAYLDGVKQTGIPTKSSSISVDHIDCDNNAVGTWSYTDWGIYITGATQRTKCTVYFVSQAYTGDTSGDSRLGNATADKVLTGSTFSSSVGTNVSGTMVNRGTLNWNPSSKTTYTVPAGYYSGGTLNSTNAYNAGYTAGQTSTNGTYVGYAAGNQSISYTFTTSIAYGYISCSDSSNSYHCIGITLSTGTATQLDCQIKQCSVCSEYSNFTNYSVSGITSGSTLSSNAIALGGCEIFKVR